MRAVLAAVVLFAAAASSTLAASLLPGFQRAAAFDEQVRWTRLDSGVRVLIDAPAKLAAPRRVLVIYATPNGNTLEQTLGCRRSKELDWRYDIQHVAAQIRRYRQLEVAEDVILAVAESPKLSWPAFRGQEPRAGRIIHDLVDDLARECQADRVVLACHSGGGSFVLGYLNTVDAIPPRIDRIVLLDANYSYSDQEHGDKLLAWLKADRARRLVVVAYDDREITFQGKKVVGPDGGTFRATRRMLARLGRDVALTESTHGSFEQTGDEHGQIHIFVHPNPENRILHTALVGEMNGLLHGVTVGTPQAETWGIFGGPRAYGDWIQPRPFTEPTPPRPKVNAPRLVLPPRPDDAPTGSAFVKQISGLSLDDREQAIVKEILRGNVPERLRRLEPIAVSANDETGGRHTGVCFVTVDYLAVGTDGDSFRVPISPGAAMRIADVLDCTLLTTKLADDVFAAADHKLAPRPLTKDRQAVTTFYQHHRLIEEQLAGKPRAGLVAGIKKDIVLTNRLEERPHKVAIYGWHRAGGQPIQPLYVGHWDKYVDYSHGVRLLARQMLVDGRPREVADVLADRRLCGLLSSEGPIDTAEVRRAAQWDDSANRDNQPKGDKR